MEPGRDKCVITCADELAAQFLSFFLKATNTELVANKDISHTGTERVVDENSPVVSANSRVETLLARLCVMETSIMKV